MITGRRALVMRASGFAAGMGMISEEGFASPSMHAARSQSPGHSSADPYQSDRKDGTLDLVRDFQADPSGETESTTSIQEALNAQTPVYVRPGRYLTDGGLRLKDRSYLFGLHAASCQFYLKPNASKHMFVINDPSVQDYALEGLWMFGNHRQQTAEIDAIHIDSGLTSASSRYLHGVNDGFNRYQAHADPRMVLRDLHIVGFSGNGLYLRSRGSGYLDKLNVFTVSKAGIFLDGTFDMTIASCFAGNTGEQAFYFDNHCASTRVFGCKGWFAGWRNHALGYGFHINGTAIQISCCESQDTAGDCFFYGGDARFCTSSALLADSPGGLLNYSRSLQEGYDQRRVKTAYGFRIEGQYNTIIGDVWDRKANGAKTYSMTKAVAFAGKAESNTFIGSTLPGLEVMKNGELVRNAASINGKTFGRFELKAGSPSPELHVFADEQSAVAAGLRGSDMYRTPDGLVRWVR